MWVTLKFELDADPDVVWDGLLDPRALGVVLQPLVRLEPVGRRRFPTRWALGRSELVRSRALGAFTLGDQVIRLAVRRHRGARILEDSGGPVSGALGLITAWRHRMAVSPSGGRGTLFRDRLDYSAGLFTAVLWPAVWALWQWRAVGIRRVLGQRRR